MDSGKALTAGIWITGALVVALGIRIVSGLGNGPGRPMPRFSMQTVDGKKLSNQDIAGRVALFYVCGEGCGACEAAGPAVTRIFDSYPEKRVAVIAGDAWNDDRAGAAALSKKLRVPTAVGIRQVARAFGSHRVPFFVVVGRDGRVVFTQEGFGDGQPLEDAVNRALTAR